MERKIAVVRWRGRDGKTCMIKHHAMQTYRGAEVSNYTLIRPLGYTV
jgi:hypothetical protein